MQVAECRWVPTKAHQRESVSLSEKSRLSVAASSGFGSEVSQQTPPGLQGMPRQTSTGLQGTPQHLSPMPGMKRQISPGMPRVQVTNSRNTTVSMRWGWWDGVDGIGIRSLGEEYHWLGRFSEKLHTFSRFCETIKRNRDIYFLLPRLGHGSSKITMVTRFRAGIIYQERMGIGMHPPNQTHEDALRKNV